MNIKIIPVSQLNDKQISDLARLHRAVIHSLLSELRLPMVEKYYQIACADAAVIGVCALDAGGSPLGWAVGSSKPDQVIGQMREAWGWFILQMIRVLVIRPRLILQLAASARSASIELKERAIELTYIGVDPSARKQGLGRELLKTFLQAAQENGYKFVVLSVEVENKDAIALYTRAGFEIVHSVKEGRFHRYRMELIIQ